MSAAELKSMPEAMADQRIVQACFSHYVFKMRAAEETYNDTTQVKLSVLR